MLLGYLGSDPELRHTQGGTAVANFSVATTRVWYQESEKKEDTQWHKIIVWGKQAENAKKYLSKGSMVYLEGHLQNRKWTDKEGVAVFGIYEE